MKNKGYAKFVGMGGGGGEQGVLWEMCKWRIINFLLFQEISIAAGHRD